MQQLRIAMLSLATMMLALIFYIQYLSLAQGLTLKEKLPSAREVVDQKPQVLLWTMRRSGSRMTQAMLKALPCTFLTEEPLKHPRFSVQLIRDIFQCRLSSRPDYFRYWINGSLPNETSIKQMCVDYPRLCSDANLTDAMCEAACVKLIRVVTVDLSTAGDLLQDPTFNVKVVHLVRDPRALISSREKLQYLRKDFRVFHDNEMNYKDVCDRYIRDLASFRFFSQHYPSRYMCVRYEDLAQHPQQEVRRLYSFLDLPYTAQVANTVASHTLGLDSDDGLDPYSTIKNSSANVFAWRDHLEFREVTRLQQECGAVLEGYGYRTYLTPRHYHDPHNTPLLPLPRPS